MRWDSSYQYPRWIQSRTLNSRLADVRFGRQPALNRGYLYRFNRQEPAQFFRVYTNQIPSPTAID